MSNTTFTPGQRVLVTIPNPHFANVAPTTWEAKFICETVYGKLVVTGQYGGDFTAMPQRVTAVTL